MPVTVAATVTPSGNFPATDSVLNKGGYMAVADITARNAIHSSRRVEGMLVGVASVDAIFQLAADLTTWNQWGDRVVATQTGHGLSVINAIYSNAGVLTKGIATSAAASEIIGFVQKVADANTVTYAKPGARVTGFSGLTAGLPYYLSPTTAGAITATEPTTVGQISKPLLIADSATSGIFVNQRGATIEAPGTPANADLLSILTAAPIEITNADTTLTIGRLHIIKATTGPVTVTMPNISGQKRKWVGIVIDATSTKLVTVDGDGVDISPGNFDSRIMHGGESAYLFATEAETEWMKSHGISIPIWSSLATSGTVALGDSVFPYAKIAATVGSDNVNGATTVASATNLLTCVRPGLFQVKGALQFAVLTAESKRTLVALGLNGGTATLNSSEAYGVIGGAPTVDLTHLFVALSVADTVELQGYQTSGVSQDISSAALSIIESPSW